MSVANEIMGQVAQKKANAFKFVRTLVDKYGFANNEALVQAISTQESADTEDFVLTVRAAMRRAVPIAEAVRAAQRWNDTDHINRLAIEESTKIAINMAIAFVCLVLATPDTEDMAKMLKERAESVSFEDKILCLRYLAYFNAAADAFD